VDVDAVSAAAVLLAQPAVVKLAKLAVVNLPSTRMTELLPTAATDVVVAVDAMIARLAPPGASYFHCFPFRSRYPQLHAVGCRAHEVEKRGGAGPGNWGTTEDAVASAVDAVRRLLPVSVDW
jgi:hypothetical protein